MENSKVNKFIDFIDLRLGVLGITKRQFIKSMDISPQTYYLWKINKHAMYLDKYFKALEVLKVKEGDWLAMYKTLTNLKNN